MQMAVTVVCLSHPLAASPMGLKALYEARTTSIGKVPAIQPALDRQEASALGRRFCHEVPYPGVSVGDVDVDGDSDSNDAIPVLRLGAGAAVSGWSATALAGVNHIRSTSHAVGVPSMLRNGSAAYFIPTDQVGGRVTTDKARREEIALGAAAQLQLTRPIPDLLLHAARSIPRGEHIASNADNAQAFPTEGVLAVFLADSAEAAAASRQHGRAWGAAAVLRWRSHTWGPDSELHSTLLQSVEPVAPGLRVLKSEAAAAVLLSPSLAGIDPEDYVTATGGRRVRPPSDAWSPPDSSEQKQVVADFKGETSRAHQDPGALREDL